MRRARCCCGRTIRFTGGDLDVSDSDSLSIVTAFGTFPFIYRNAGSFDGYYSFLEVPSSLFSGAAANVKKTDWTCGSPYQNWLLTVGRSGSVYLAQPAAFLVSGVLACYKDVAIPIVYPGGGPSLLRGMDGSVPISSLFGQATVKAVSAATYPPPSIDLRFTLSTVNIDAVLTTS